MEFGIDKCAKATFRRYSKVKVEYDNQGKICKEKSKSQAGMELRV